MFEPCSQDLIWPPELGLTYRPVHYVTVERKLRLKTNCTAAYVMICSITCFVSFTLCTSCFLKSLRRKADSEAYSRGNKLVWLSSVFLYLFYLVCVYLIQAQSLWCCECCPSVTLCSAYHHDSAGWLLNQCCISCGAALFGVFSVLIVKGP